MAYTQGYMLECCSPMLRMDMQLASPSIPSLQVSA